MVLETRKRREHLSNDDLMKNKALLENFAKGNAQYLEQQQQTQNGEVSAHLAFFLRIGNFPKMLGIALPKIKPFCQR